MEAIFDLDETLILLYFEWKPHQTVMGIEFKDVFDVHGHLSDQAKRLSSLIGLVDCLTGRNRSKLIPEQHQFMYMVGYSEGKKFMEEFREEPFSPYDA